MNDTTAALAAQRRQWAELSPAQQMQRVQIALLDFQDHAIRRRQQARQQMTARLHAQRARRPARDYDPL